MQSHSGWRSARWSDPRRPRRKPGRPGTAQHYMTNDHIRPHQSKTSIWSQASIFSLSGSTSQPSPLCSRSRAASRKPMATCSVHPGPASMSSTTGSEQRERERGTGREREKFDQICGTVPRRLDVAPAQVAAVGGDTHEEIRVGARVLDGIAQARAGDDRVVEGIEQEQRRADQRQPLVARCGGVVGVDALVAVPCRWWGTCRGGQGVMCRGGQGMTCHGGEMSAQAGQGRMEDGG